MIKELTVSGGLPHEIQILSRNSQGKNFSHREVGLKYCEII